MSDYDSPSVSAAARADRPRGWTADLALTGFLLLTTVLPYFLMLTYGLWGQATWAEIMVGMAMVCPLALRTHFPHLMLGLATFAGMAHLMLISTPLPCLIVIPIMVYSFARWTDARGSRAVLVIGGAASVLGPWSWSREGWEFNVVVLAMLVCIGMVLTPYAVGRRLRESELSKIQKEQTAAERYRRLLAEREQQARMVEVQTRQQIARELHDIVAHSVSVMVVQAEGGRALAAKKPEAAAEVLDTIATTGREALTEMRRIVGVLRSGPEDESSYSPAPGLADISELVRRTGDNVTLTVDGPIPPCGQAAQLTIYRVVQEGLTNFLKHAGPNAQAQVELCYSADRISATVTDNGRGVNSFSDGRGHGLKGMHERVQAMGGTLEVGPKPGGGFRVHAEIPVLPTGRQPRMNPQQCSTQRPNWPSQGAMPQ